MKIELPKTLGDFKLKPLSDTIIFLQTNPFEEIEDPEKEYEAILTLINIVSGAPKKELEKQPMSFIKEAFNHLLKILKTNKKKPRKKINIKGVNYYFEDNLSHKSWTFGRYIDSMNKTIDLKEQPEYICAICYIEEGKEYGEVKLNDRAKIFKEEFNGEDFVNLTSFFLRKYERLMPGYLVLREARNQIAISKQQKITREPG